MKNYLFYSGITNVYSQLKLLIGKLNEISTYSFLKRAIYESTNREGADYLKCIPGFDYSIDNSYISLNPNLLITPEKSKAAADSDFIRDNAKRIKDNTIDILENISKYNQNILDYLPYDMHNQTDRTVRLPYHIMDFLFFFYNKIPTLKALLNTSKINKRYKYYLDMIYRDIIETQHFTVSDKLDILNLLERWTSSHDLISMYLIGEKQKNVIQSEIVNIFIFLSQLQGYINKYPLLEELFSLFSTEKYSVNEILLTIDFFINIIYPIFQNEFFLLTQTSQLKNCNEP